MTARALALQDLARAVADLRHDHTCRVAVDGRTASGKTTLADELGPALEGLGRPVIRASVDGFHRPRAERYRKGRFSAVGYYEDARDLDAFRALLLDPLGRHGDGGFRLASLNLETDAPADAPLLTVPEDAILIVDGTFLQRPELADCWEAVVFVDVAEAAAAARGMARDGKAAERLYAERYRPAFDHYEARCRPELSADAIWNNEDPTAPRLDFRQGGRLAP